MPSTQKLHVVALPGDGIGPEVFNASRPVLEKAVRDAGAQVQVDVFPVGGACYDQYGKPLTDEILNAAKKSDAVLLGAVGGPKWEPLDYSVRPERALLALRKELNLFANLRPAVCFAALADASPLKRELVEGLDILVLRELTGGLYFGTPRGVEGKGDARVGRNTMQYGVEEIRRIGRAAFEAARKRRKLVTSVDKANVLEVTELWREIMIDLQAKEYPDCTLNHMYVDNAAMQLVRWPKQFDVLVTENMFGDILSDIASQLTGSIGMLASASLGSGTQGMYEPVHGSAPDIAGKAIANPLAMILSVAMMLRHSFNMGSAADRIERAVVRVLDDGVRTADIAAGKSAVGTQAMADAVIHAMDKV